ncbi:MAG TPA: M48 family metalloprotease [Tepidisphaeraceae bacterium]|jgi:predicted Zn-dependent protease
MKTTKTILAAAILCGLVGGCGSGGSSSGGGGGGLGGIAGTGISLGQFIPGQAGQYADAGVKGLSAASMNETDEDELGRSVAIAATNRWPVLDNPNLTKYVTMVGLSLADATGKPDGNWVFGVLDTPDVGAYSGPNGYIMVTRGAIQLMQDESELAGVLAHEMGHVIDRDGFKTVQTANLVGAGMEAASAADRRVAMFNQASDLLVNTVFSSGWNQGQETGADTKAVQLLIASGYDPHGLARFLQRMQAAGGSRGARPFGTHPGTGDRIAHISSQAGGRGGATNADRFAKAKADAKL